MGEALLPSLPPLSLTRFVGRGRELTTLRAAIRAHRLVTVCGPPGVGKTRLVTEALSSDDAALARHKIAYCAAADSSTVEGLRELVARALGSRARELGPTLLRDAGQVLLVIDDFEGLVDSSAAQIGEWLLHAPRARCLVVSRRRLGIEGERVFTLSVLPHDGAALELLLDRVSLLRDAPFDARERVALARIAEILDGLPLALELAAARLGSRSPEELLDELERGSSALRAPSSDRSARRVSLEASIHLSVRRLDARAQRALAALTVLRGPFSLAAAQAVAEVDAAVIDELCDHSLVMRAIDRATRTTRYWLLFCVRDFVARRLDSTARGDAEDRHSAHFLRCFRERVIERDPYDELATLRAEHENLVVVLDRALRRDPTRDVDRRWALEASIVLEELCAALGARASGRWGEALTDEAARVVSPDTLAVALAQRALRAVRRDGLAAPSSDLDRALSFELPPRVRIRVLGIAADFHMLRGEFGPARPLLEEGLERAVAVGCRYTEGRLRTELACALHALGARDEAVAHLEEAVRLLSDGEHCYGLIVALHWLGTSRLDAEQPDEALELLERALALDTEGQVDLIRAFLRVRVGVAAWMAGRSDVAKQHFEQSIADFEALEEPSGTIGSRLHLALVHAHAGDVPKCEATLRAMVEVMRRMGLYRERRRPLFEAHTVYAHARAARKRHGDESPETVEAHARAREVVDALCEEMAAETPLYARAFRLLAAAVEASAPERAAPIVVDRGGGGFVSPSGARVDLEGRPVLARVLEAIVAAAERAPGRPVERASIVEHAWAGERMSDASASSRVYVAVSTLRKLGLRDALRSVEGGYLLDLTRVRIAHRRHAHASTNEQGAGPPER